VISHNASSSFCLSSRMVVDPTSRVQIWFLLCCTHRHVFARAARHRRFPTRRHPYLYRRIPHVLLLVQVQLPLDDAEADTRHYDDDHADIGRFGAASSKVIVLICHSLVLCLHWPSFPLLYFVYWQEMAIFSAFGAGAGPATPRRRHDDDHADIGV
jgi:hypothetical protein